jgi:uncharacterized membrane protein YozB (DUF420 family)
MDGFLPGSRASIMLDVVFLAMFAVVPVLGWSVYQVKYRGRYLLHKRVQVAMSLILLVAVGLFEVDVRLNDWRPRAEASPYMHNGVIDIVLPIHLVFAISTFVLWAFVLIQALRKIPNPPGPCAYSPTHIRWARIAAIDMCLTAVTGWTFYWMAFMAT